MKKTLLSPAQLTLLSVPVDSLESARVAVVGTLSDFDMLHPKVRQLFADEVLLEVGP